METINDRISRLVRELCNNNNSDFANKIGVNEANIRNYRNGTEPKFSVIEKIAKNFEVNYEWLLTGEGEMKKELKNSLTLNEPSSEYIKRAENKVPQVITVDSEGRDNIVLVPVQAQAGYLTGYNDPQFIQTLPTYRLPGVANGIFRMFQVGNFSMLPTIHDKAYVVSEFVDDWINGIKDDRVYVIITKNDGVVVKRVLNRIEKYKTLYCKSDNRREYPNITLPFGDIKEVWECKVNLSFEFPNPATLYDRINDLEAEIMHLKERKKQ